MQDYGMWERGDKTNHGLPGNCRKPKFFVVSYFELCYADIGDFNFKN